MSVQDRLKIARSQLDNTDYLALALTGSDVPESGAILIKVCGTRTHQPTAFKGAATIKLPARRSRPT